MIVKKGKVPVILEGTIIDVETTGLNPVSDSVITLGLIHGKCYEVFQSTTDDTRLPGSLSSLFLSLPRPFFAFNKSFEEAFLGIGIDCELQLCPFESKRDAIRVSGVEDPLGGDGERVPSEWRAYCENRNLDHLERIIAHNMADLQYELCLAIVRSRGPQVSTSTPGGLLE